MSDASRTARRPRSRRRAGLAASIVALGLVLTGCSQPGQTKNYNEQTQSNFIDACKTANEQKKLDDAEAQRICDCWYGAITGEGGVSFDQFKKDEENIREALDKGEFNDEDDFQRVAPSTFNVVSENCVEVGPRAS